MLQANLDKTFHDSFARVTGDAARNKQFFDRFYDLFFAADPGIAERFEGRDMERQKHMLLDSLLVMVRFFATHEVTEELDALARIHGPKQLDIPGDYYDLWINALVEAVREVDPKANEEVELSWRVALAPGVAFMKWCKL